VILIDITMESIILISLFLNLIYSMETKRTKNEMMKKLKKNWWYLERNKDNFPRWKSIQACTIFQARVSITYELYWLYSFSPSLVTNKSRSTKLDEVKEARQLHKQDKPCIKNDSYRMSNSFMGLSTVYSSSSNLKTDLKKLSLIIVDYGI